MIDSHLRKKQMMNPSLAWSPPASFPRLTPGEVHLWCASLANYRQEPETIQLLRQLLTTDEIERAERFYFEHHQVDFVVARGLLRMLLERYLGHPAGALRFDYSSFGKPSLEPEFRQPPNSKSILHFNLSHSADYVLYAFVLDHEIGVDIEYVKRDFPCLQVAENFFSAQEQTFLRSLATPQEQYEAFFNCWTRKEAYIKAQGEGLSLPLSQFDVTLGESARLLATRPNAGEAERWQMQNLSPVAEYAAAVIVESGTECWSFRTFGLLDVGE